MSKDVILYATFDPAANPDGGDKLVACDALGRLEVVTAVPPGGDEIQGEIPDSAPSLLLKPVQVSGKDAGGINRALLVDAFGRAIVTDPALDVPLSSRASEATLFAFAAFTATRLDVALSTRASEATLLAIKDTDGIKKITDALPTGANTIGKVDQGLPAVVGNAWPTLVTDGVDTAEVRNTPPAAGDEGLVTRNIPSGTQDVNIVGGGSADPTPAKIIAFDTQLNALATATMPAPGAGLFNYVTAILASYDSAAALLKKLSFVDDVTLKFTQFTGKTEEPIEIVFDRPYKAAVANTAVHATLEAGGAMKTGNVTLIGYTAP